MAAAEAAGGYKRGALIRDKLPSVTAGVVVTPIKCGRLCM